MTRCLKSEQTTNLISIFHRTLLANDSSTSPKPSSTVLPLRCSNFSSAILSDSILFLLAKICGQLKKGAGGGPIISVPNTTGRGVVFIHSNTAQCRCNVRYVSGYVRHQNPMGSAASYSLQRKPIDQLANKEQVSRIRSVVSPLSSAHYDGKSRRGAHHMPPVWGLGG